MKKVLITLLTIGSITLGYSQKGHHDHASENNTNWIETRSAQLTFPNLPITHTPEATISTYLNLPQGYQLSLNNQIQGKTGNYLLFDVTFEEKPVYTYQVKAKVDFNRNVRFIGHNLSIIEEKKNTTFPEPTFILLSTLEAQEVLDYKKVWFPQPHQVEAALYVNFVSKEGHHEEAILNINGQILFEKTLDRFFAGGKKDSVVKMKVFNPDPLTTANKTYGGNYIDNADQNLQFLDPLRSTKFEKVSFNKGKFTLENSAVKIVDIQSPRVAVVSSSQNSLEFSRNDGRFEQVNAYYHITQVKKNLDQLGFNTLVPFQIKVDANSMNGADQSMFSAATYPPQLHFGTGGVDDAEDADVIVHEYGHAILYSAAPFTNYGMERQTLEEAFCDFMAARYSKAQNNFNYKKIFNWDGHNQYWSGRSIEVGNKTYAGLTFSGMYDHTNLWAGTCNKFAEQVGDAAADELILESLFGYFGNMNFKHAAMLIAHCDSSLNNNKHIVPFVRAFSSTGLVESSMLGMDDQIANDHIQITNTIAFAQGGALKIHLESGMNAQILLTNLAGQTIQSFSISEDTEISSQEMAAGVYTLSISTNGTTCTQKVVKW